MGFFLFLLLLPVFSVLAWEARLRAFSTQMYNQSFSKSLQLPWFFFCVCVFISLFSACPARPHSSSSLSHLMELQEAANGRRQARRGFWVKWTQIHSVVFSCVFALGGVKGKKNFFFFYIFWKLFFHRASKTF